MNDRHLDAITDRQIAEREFSLSFDDDMARSFLESLAFQRQDDRRGIGPRLYVGRDSDVLGGPLDVLRLVESQLAAHPQLDARGIHVTMEGGALTLSGWVASAEHRDLVASFAARSAKAVGEKVEIVNRLRLIWDGLREIGW